MTAPPMAVLAGEQREQIIVGVHVQLRAHRRPATAVPARQAEPEVDGLERAAAEEGRHGEVRLEERERRAEGRAAAARGLQVHVRAGAGLRRRPVGEQRSEGALRLHPRFGPSRISYLGPRDISTMIFHKGYFLGSKNSFWGLNREEGVATLWYSEGSLKMSYRQPVSGDRPQTCWAGSSS